jgi:hypothetical protein
MHFTGWLNAGKDGILIGVHPAGFFKTCNDTKFS